MSAAHRGGERRAFDAYFTPDDVARRLVAELPLDAGSRVLEPHGGGGAFVRALLGAGHEVHTGDLNGARAQGLHAAGAATVRVGDFLARDDGGWDAIVGNPPYEGALRHVSHALSLVREGGCVAMLLRLAVLEGVKRRAFWRDHPAASVHVITPRPSFTTKGSDSAAYGWFIWVRGHAGPTRGSIVAWREARRRLASVSTTGRSAWALLNASARGVLDRLELTPGDRIAVLDGRDPLYPVSRDGWGAGTLRVVPRPMWLIGAPTTGQLYAHLSDWRQSLDPDGTLVLMLPLRVLESVVQRALWTEHRPSRVVVLSNRPRLSNGKSGNQAIALFFWRREGAADDFDLSVRGTGEPVGAAPPAPSAPLAPPSAPLAPPLDRPASFGTIHRDDVRFGPWVGGAIGAQLERASTLTAAEELAEILRAACPPDVAAAAVRQLAVGNPWGLAIASVYTRGRHAWMPAIDRLDRGHPLRTVARALFWPRT